MNSMLRLLSAADPSTSEFDKRDMLARNRLASVSFFVCSMGELVVLAILCGILFAVVKNDDAESNTRSLSIVCAYSAGVWGKLTTSSVNLTQFSAPFRGSSSSSTGPAIACRPTRPT